MGAIVPLKQEHHQLSWLAKQVEMSQAQPELVKWLDGVVRQSSLIPDRFKNIIDVAMLVDISKTTGDALWTVAENLYVINGRMFWSAQYVIGKINSCKRFSGFVMQKNVLDDGDILCTASAKDIASGNIVSASLTLKQARALGGNSKIWGIDPERMLEYRTGCKFGYLYISDILLGLGDGELDAETFERIVNADPFE